MYDLFTLIYIYLDLYFTASEMRFSSSLVSLFDSSVVFFVCELTFALLFWC